MGVNERPKRKNAGSKMTAIVSKEKEIDGNDIHETSSSDSNKTTEAIIHPDDNEDEPHIGIFQTPEIPDETTEAIIRPDDSEKMNLMLVSFKHQQRYQMLRRLLLTT